MNLDEKDLAVLANIFARYADKTNQPDTEKKSLKSTNENPDKEEKVKVKEDKKDPHETNTQAFSETSTDSKNGEEETSENDPDAHELTKWEINIIARNFPSVSEKFIKDPELSSTEAKEDILAELTNEKWKLDFSALDLRECSLETLLWLSLIKPRENKESSPSNFSRKVGLQIASKKDKAATRPQTRNLIL